MRPIESRLGHITDHLFDMSINLHGDHKSDIIGSIDTTKDSFRREVICLVIAKGLSDKQGYYRVKGLILFSTRTGDMQCKRIGIFEIKVGHTEPWNRMTITSI